MKLNKILLTATFLLGGLCASAQEEVIEYDFTPHVFGQLQVGGQESLGEGPFGKLLSPNAQLAVGYQFSPVFGLRLAVNGWQSKGTTKPFDTRYNWKWNYVSPTLDAMINVTNLLGGYNPTRLVDVNLIAGVGVNCAWNNKQARNVNAALLNEMGIPATGLPSLGEAPNDKDFSITEAMWDGYDKLTQGFNGTDALGHLWKHGRTRFVGQFGFDVNFNITNRLQLGVELMANVLNDQYNSKKAPNADWYFNGLIGVKYAFGPTYAKRVRVIEPVVPCEPQIIEKIVEKIVEVPIEVQEQKKEVTSFRRDVFFKINLSTISAPEMEKVKAVAEYLKAHPNSHVTITGYADKGTGTKAFNLRLSAKRSESVARTLRTKFGIDPSRITVKSMGEDEYQPYPDPIQCRVAICVAD